MLWSSSVRQGSVKLVMDNFKSSVRNRTLIALFAGIGLLLVLGFFWVNQNNCDLVGNLERHDCDLSKLENQ